MKYIVVKAKTKFKIKLTIKDKLTQLQINQDDKKT